VSLDLVYTQHQPTPVNILVVFGLSVLIFQCGERVTSYPYFGIASTGFDTWYFVYCFHQILIKFITVFIGHIRRMIPK
jgi:hypothetical protein